MTRFSDEFDAYLFSTQSSLNGRKSIRWIFADLDWDGPSKDFIVQLEKDPAFEIRGELRLMAFHRVGTQIRYWAGARGDILNATERDPHWEEGIAGSVEAAVRLAHEYLSGKPLLEIQAQRSKRRVG